jgi:hypothetical protein
VILGINNACFLGTLEDWQKLQRKTANLAQYSLKDGDKWAVYVQKVLIILQQFVRTYQNDVDVSWWNTIFTTEEERRGSGGGGGTLISGWFLHLIGTHFASILSLFQN